MTSSVGYKRKIGLVIGINQYPRDSLQYCINDATDLTNTLQSIGFQITLGKDCDLIKFRNIIDTFIKTIERDDLVLFYYAGHGKQNEDENYLLPSDYNYDYSGHERDYIVNNGVNVKYIMNKIEDKICRITIYLFDCCRSKIRTRDPDGKQGLSSINAPAQTLIVFACAPGKAVLDETKNNKNGSFIENLLKHISTPDKDIDEVMKIVAGDVNRQTFGFQLPYRTSSLIDLVYLVTNNNQDQSNTQLQSSAIFSPSIIDKQDNHKQTSGSQSVTQESSENSSKIRSSSEFSHSDNDSMASSTDIKRQLSSFSESTQLDNANEAFKTQEISNMNTPHCSTTPFKDDDTSISSNSTQSPDKTSQGKSSTFV
ncbi:unnamed protein product [Adineta steineri]|uniref:Caspase family p20 domain-containing protein n=1 Tax=Adineta steineri TaxID=433720 RepID=A0A815EI65_9BILA|nr:unnamed protein product [Adineta steineri]CAF3508078.1 unnamed protein product [Adineta steineri]